MSFRLLTLLSIAACGVGLDDPQFATGSSTIVATARGAVVNVNEDEGTISWRGADSDTALEIDVDGRPARVARVGNTVWVTLRTERSVAVFDLSEGARLTRIATLPAGVEPYGIVATEDGKRVFVASSRTNEVLEFDGESRTLLRTFSVPDEPRWLALHPSGKALYVASLFHGTFSQVDLETGVRTPVALPVTTRRGQNGVDVQLSARLSGDPAVDPRGKEVAIPLVFVDNETPVDSGDLENPGLPTGGYGSSGLGVSRLNPSLVTIEVGRSGDVQGPGRALFLASTPSGQFMEEPIVTQDDFELNVIRSYPTSVTFTSDSYLVTAESSSSIYAVRRAPFVGATGDESFTDGSFGTVDTGRFANNMPFTSAEAAGFETWPVLPIETGAGPRGIAMLNARRAVVHTFLNRSVADVDVLQLDRDVRQFQSQFFVSSSRADYVAGPVLVAEQSLTDAEERGRHMFYSANDARMAGTGAGVSCSTCHFDSRNDGFTWEIDGRPFQTPSLGGPVSQTAPVTWADDVPSVGREAQLTTQLRMGGEGLSESEADDIGAYVDTTPFPQGARDASEPLVVQGLAVFQASGCHTCHTGELLTDNLSHEIFPGMPTQTPTLRGVAASAPYLHDGRAATLDDVVRFTDTGQMGNTSELTDDERRALVAYLESL